MGNYAEIMGKLCQIMHNQITLPNYGYFCNLIMVWLWCITADYGVQIKKSYLFLHNHRQIMGIFIRSLRFGYEWIRKLRITVNYGEKVWKH